MPSSVGDADRRRPTSGARRASARALTATPDDADREPGPQARIAALLAAADREARRHERRQAEHREGRQRRGHAQGEAAIHPDELDDLQQHADPGEPNERRAAPTPGAQRQRHGHQRGKGEAHREQRERVGLADGERAHDVARAPQDDEEREDEAVGHACMLAAPGAATNRSSPGTDAHL